MALKSSKSKVNIGKKGTVGILVTSSGSVRVDGDVNVNVYDTSQNDLEFGDFDLPRLTNTFKGREEEMQILDNLYFTQKETNVVICGLPGFGKTELSKQFANRCVENNKIHRVFWVNSENKDDLRNSFKTLKKIYTSFKEKITLFVFDNAACLQDIFDYMPPDNKNNFLLITSREKDWKDFRPVPLNPLSSASAVEVYKSFLKEQFREDHHDMYVKLAAVVDYVPLGLQITGAFVREQIMALQEKFDFRQYITLLKESKKDILNATIPLNIPNTYKKSIYGAIIVSLKKIQTAQDMKRGDLAINILYMCSYLDPDHIEFKELLEVTEITELLKTNINIENEIALALHLLANLLFINYKLNDKYLTIHRLIQDVVRLHLLKCDDEVRFRAYTMSLQLTFETKREFAYFSHCNSVLIYADENVPSVLNFYKMHAFKSNEILNRFLSSLTACECFACLTKIVENNNMNTEYMTESNLKSEALLKLLKHYDVDFKRPDAWQITPLHFAASKINLYALKIIAAFNVDLNARDSYGGTALLYFINKACQSEKINIDEANQILDLMKLNENKDVTNNKGQTILHCASYYSSHNTEILHLLLKRGLDVNSKCKDQRTALHLAASGSNLDAMKLLIQNNADLKARDCYGDTALLHFIRNTWNRKNINVDEANQILDLLKLDKNKNVTNNRGHTLLHYASYYSSHNTGLLNLLLKRGLDIYSRCNDQSTALHAAAFQRNLDVIKLLIKNSAELNSRNSNGETPLFCFIQSACDCESINIDDVKQTFDLLKLDENKDVRNNIGQTILHYASLYSSHNTEILHLLLNHGLNINSKSDDQSTALHIVALKSNLNAIQLLIQNNADLNIRDSDGDTALFCFIRSVCECERINIDEVNQILKLLKLDENKHVRNNKGHTLLHYACLYSSQNTDILHLLLKRGLDVNSKCDDQRSALHIAALESNLNAIKLLIQNNADLNSRDCDGDTALFCFIQSACECERIDIDEINQILDLLKLNENKNTRNNIGHTLLHYASLYSSQNTDILHLLLKRGLDVNSKCEGKRTALHIAALKSNLNEIQFLIQNNADLNTRDTDGDTALFCFIRKVCESQRINMDEVNQILKLLKLDENKDVRNNKGHTLLHYACLYSSQNTDILHLLLERGLDVNSKCNEQRSVLHIAALKSNLNAIKLLIQNNADLNSRDCDGDTALFGFIQSACECERIDIDEISQILDLLKLNENKNIRNNIGHTLLHHASLYSSQNTDILHLLLKRGLDVNSKCDDQRSALHITAWNNNLDAMKLLILNNADLNARDCNGDTALFFYIRSVCKCERINTDEVNQILNLLKLDENKYIRNNLGHALLHHASINSSHNTDILHLLLTRGLDVNSKRDDQSTALHITAQRSNLNAMKLLIHNSADLNARDCDGNTALFWFIKSVCECEKINIDEVKQIFNLLKLGENRDVRNNVGLTLLHYASYYSSHNTKILHLLLIHNLDVNSKCKDQSTALQIAALGSNLDAMKLLIYNNADLNARDCDGDTPLFFFIRSVCKCERINIDEINKILDLLQLDENKNTRNNIGHTLLHYASLYISQNIDILHLLLKRGLDVNSKCEEKRTALHIAVRRRNLNAMKLLIQNNADLNVRDCNGDTALFCFIRSVCKCEGIDIDEANHNLDLLKLDENKNIRNNIGHTLLHYASFYSSQNTDILHLLLKRGLDVNSKCDDQRSALHITADRSNLDAMKVLIQSNADVNARDCNGDTPLAYFIRNTCKRENINVDEVNHIFGLLKFNENKNFRNNKGQTLLHYASYYSSYNTTILHLLLKHNLEVNSKCNDQSTALHFAARGSNLDAMKLLIQNNADLNARDCDGDTALLHFIRNTCNHENINVDEANQILDLLKLDENKDVRNNVGYTLLYYSAYYSSNNTGLLNLLLKRGLDINSKCNDQSTALHAAALGSNLDAMQLLIQRNADLNARDCNGKTVLFYFIIGTYKRDNITIDELNKILDLLQYNRNKSDTDNYNNTLLFLAAESCHENIISFLITQYDMNVNHQNIHGDTPLHNVIKLEDLFSRSKEDIIRSVETLKKHGSRLDIKNKNKKTPLLIAQEKRAEFLIPYLIDTAPGAVAAREKHKWVSDMKSKLKMKFKCK